MATTGQIYLKELIMSESIFNEAEYLKANPDAASAVKEGNFRSGRERYEMFGAKEGVCKGHVQ